MRPIYRWIIAVVMALVFLGLSAAVYITGFFLGGFMTDSCSGNLGFASIYLEFIWPVVMFIAAIVPPILVLRKVRWYWVLISAAIGLAVSVLAYLLYLPLLSFFC